MAGRPDARGRAIALPRHQAFSRHRPRVPTIPLISTTVAVAGEDYVIIAASTRLSTGYSILTRGATKFVQL